MSLPVQTKRAQIYIGVIISIGIFLILSQAVASLAFSVYDLVGYTRARVSARNIAQEQIELIRNAPYDDVGTVGGIPAGIFEQTETTSRNGLTYTTRTRISYVDDPFDGVAPTDTLPNDYKRVRVDVSWGGIAESRASEVTLVTDISPKDIESSVGGGTLSILVFDANGQPVSQAEVQISETVTNPQVNATYYTSDTGYVTLPGAPACNTCYQITVTKAGMSTDRTYSTSEVTNPTKPLATVLDGQLTEVSFSIDNFASLSLTTLGAKPDFPALGGQIVRVRGEKTIGTDGLDNPVYKYDQDVVTDAGGALSIDQLEWDNYHILLPVDTTMQIAGLNPLSPISINPSDSINLLVSMVPKNGSSLLSSFEDGSGNLVASVSATLSDGTGFVATDSSGVSGQPDFGQTFFNGLADKVYTLIATASGFVDFNNSVTISGDVNERIILTPL